MNDEIEIIINHRVLDSIWNNDKILIITLLLIIKYYLKGKTNSVDLDLLTYVFDLLRKDTEITKDNVLLSTPWDIFDLRAKIILAYEMDLINIMTKNNNSKIGFQLKDKGGELLNRLEQDILINNLNKKVEKLAATVKSNNLQKQHLIW